MKLRKLSLAVAVAASVVGVVTVAQATVAPFVTDGTYVFTATDGNTPFDGSFVTIVGNKLVNWKLLDIDQGPGSKFPPTQIPLTTANSTLNFAAYDHGFEVIGPNQWDFAIISMHPGVYYADWYSGSENEQGAGVGALYNGFGDPIGTWDLVPAPAGGSGVPDASSTLPLLGLALTALAGGKSWLRSRSAH